LLYPLATGGETRVVTDAAALQAAQEKAFFTDNPGATLKHILMSFVFLNPSGAPPGNRFVSVVKDKESIETFTCFAAYCDGRLATETPHTRNLAGLLETSHPVEYVVEHFRHHDKARAAHFRLLREDDVVQIDAPDLPAPGTIVYPYRVALHLPAILLETDETGQTPLQTFDEAALEARFRAAFIHAYPKVDEYRLGKLNLSTSYAPLHGWPIVSDAFEGYLRGVGEAQQGLDRVMVIEPRVSVDLHGAMHDALMGANAFAEMPEFLPPEPASIAERLDRMAETHLGRPCPGCFKIELPVVTNDKIKVEPREPKSYSLSYYRITAP